MTTPSSETYPNTWEGVLAAAEEAGARYPELVAAQWALESGWGEHVSGEHNYFGLKGKGSDCVTEEYVNGKKITITDSFIDFEDLYQCVSYLVSRWYQDWNDYKGVNNAANREEAAKELVEQGYATDPDYAVKLIKIMKDKTGKTVGTKEKKQEKPVLFRMTAVRETYLKKEPKQATELERDQKKLIGKGYGYAVIGFEEMAGYAHARVELAANSGTWYIYEPHWERDQPIGEALPAEVNWSDFNCLVTPNLTVGEILQWDTRRIPTDDAVRNQILKTAEVFQQVRDAWGSPLGVTSFYRPAAINAVVGGVSNSKHITGEAVDIYPVNKTIDSLYLWLRSHWTGGLGDGRPRGFIHIDTRNGGGFVPGGGVRPSVEWLY